MNKYTKVTIATLDSDQRLVWETSSVVRGQGGNAVATAAADVIAGFNQEPDPDCFPFMLLSELERLDIAIRYKDQYKQRFWEAIVNSWREWWEREDDYELWEYMIERVPVLLADIAAPQPPTK